MCVCVYISDVFFSVFLVCVLLSLSANTQRTKRETKKTLLVSRLTSFSFFGTVLVLFIPFRGHFFYRFVD